MELTAEAVKEYLNTDEGKTLLGDFTAPLTNNRNQILEEKRKINERLDVLAKDHERLTLELEKERQERKNMMIEKELLTAFDRLKVIPDYRTALKAHFIATGIEVSEKGVMRDGMPLADALTLWAETPEAKAFIAAPRQTGGAAGGGSATPGARADYSSMTSEQILKSLR